MMEYSNTTIRKMKDSDLWRVYEWRNHPSVRKGMFNSHVISKSSHEKWFEKLKNDKNCCLLLIQNNKQPFGFTQLSYLACRTIADWGFYVAPNSTRGLGNILGQRVLEYCFNDLGLHKICGQVLSFNTKSINLHLRLGFQKEGILRNQHLIDNSYYDIYEFGIMNNEWKMKNEKNDICFVPRKDEL